MRIPLLVTALFTLLICGCRSATNEHSEASLISGKPAVPITLTIEPRDELTPGSIVDFDIIAMPGIDVADLQLIVDVPDSLAIYSGDREWRGPVSAGQQHVLVLSLRIPTEGYHRIVATAKLHLGSNQMLRGLTVYELGQAPEPTNVIQPRIVPRGLPDKESGS